MSAEDPIDAYMVELRAHLRARGRRRQRIVEEVEDHLSARCGDLRRQGLSEPRAAAREAIARFGDARGVADQFNAQRRPRIVERRLTALWVSWIAAMAMGTATVWAAVDSPGARSRIGRGAAAAPISAPARCGGAADRASNLLGVDPHRLILQPVKQRGPRGEQPTCP